MDVSQGGLRGGGGDGDDNDDDDDDDDGWMNECTFLNHICYTWNRRFLQVTKSPVSAPSLIVFVI